MSEIPQWAMERVAELTNAVAGHAFFEPKQATELYLGQAFAHYIAAHEGEPVEPVDPVESIFNSAKFYDRYDARSGAMDAEVFRAELAERGLEIRPVSS